ncbi:MAG TPA: bacterial transcriptional activator domain-containing protein [Ideonella sp.]|uniref:AfsR/SARP family transcriptional regulator n=2 Tax=Ideonella sp. TaxID=1929293 RepID=UPI002BD2C1DF|nr:bacterial transcriptional activator domain-containing protein [Ideonella sp.]HSI48772.1 bacterial transcriptional activator domain-containing protein [Ideonella sp.]
MDPLCQGLTLSHAGHAGAMALLREAHARSLELHDERGVLMSAAALVLTSHTVGNFRDMAEMLKHVAALKQPAPALRAPDDELLGRTALLIGQLYVDLDDPDTDANVARLLALLEQPGGLDVNLRLAAARILLYFVEPRELRELGLRVNALVLPHLTDNALQPHRHGQWLLRWRSCAGYAKDPLQEAAATESARALAERHGLRDVRFTLAFDEVGHSLNGGDLRRAEAALADAEALVDPGSLRELMLLDVTRMRVALIKGQVDDALFRAVRARKLAVELQCPGPMLGAYIVNEASVRLLLNDGVGARRQMEEAIPLLPPGFAQEVREMIAAMLASEALDREDPRGREMMALVWAGLRERQFYDSFDGHPAFKARICMQALAQRIEVEFVTSVIRKCGLAPPANAPETWPWRLRVYALGRFEVQRDGVPLTAEGKGQRKPMELLRALIAHGATSRERGLPTGELIDLLWPDLEADAPKASFDMTLMRLRKLLQVDGALTLAEGRLWLDPALVWCDVTAFERDCHALTALPEAPGKEAELSAAARRLRLRRDLRLFGSTSVEGWATLARERLATRFANAITAYGCHLEEQAAWIAAIALYGHGATEDPLAEPFYRGLMRSHLALDQPAAAMRSFQRCRELLANVLGVPPSRETLALLARIPQA